ncbi:MAG: hypothetical protein ACI9SP_000824 [Arenicella sp.]|jgi:hypothetical protein
MAVNIRVVSYVLLLTLMLSINASAQEKPDNALFSFSGLGPTLSSQMIIGQPIAAARSISINRKVAAFEAGQRFIFPLSASETIEITVTSTSTLQNGDTLLKGSFASDGSAIITFGANATFANLSSAEHSYAISLDQNQGALLINNKLINFEIDKSNDMVYPPDFEPMSHLNEPVKSARGIATAEMNSGKSDVTMLFIYSSEFASGFTNPVTRINQMIAFTNDAYVRSGINIELKLAHARQVNFNNAENPGTLLSQSRQGTGSFSNVHAIRDQYYADMVAVLPFKSSGGIAGIAYVNGNNQAVAYSVSQFAVWGSDSLFAHEIGHNLGSGHERRSANTDVNDQPSPCTGGYTGYACGHGNNSEGTIMSYLNDRRWGYVFSNPQLDCLGEPCGIAERNSSGVINTEAADNRTSFNITGPLIEVFRVDNSNDDDKDGIKNDVDNCPDVVNSDQLNTDSDSQGDACDNDDDNDNINDNLDNCRLVPNADQLDSNNNGIGNACENSEICFPIKSSRATTAVVCL